MKINKHKTEYDYENDFIQLDWIKDRIIFVQFLRIYFYIFIQLLSANCYYNFIMDKIYLLCIITLQSWS